jgi:hypothetical protein
MEGGVGKVGLSSKLDAMPTIKELAVSHAAV